MHVVKSSVVVSYRFADIRAKLIQDNRIRYLPVDKEQYTRIVIRRKQLWKDSVAQFQSVNENKYIRVTFVGEPGEDEGGPHWELKAWVRVLECAL